MGSYLPNSILQSFVKQNKWAFLAFDLWLMNKLLREKLENYPHKKKLDVTRDIYWMCVGSMNPLDYSLNSNSEQFYI